MDKDKPGPVRHLGSPRLEMEPPIVEAPSRDVELTQSQFEAEIELAWADEVH